MILGIDFGTTNSEVAVYRRGRAVPLAQADGERMIASVVYIDEEGVRHVGRSAKNVAVLHPGRTVKSVKRDLGSSRRYWIDGQEHTPEQIAAEIFRRLKGVAEGALGGPVSQAVVTVPANFDDRKRQATRKAAALAGLEAVRLVNEPTAAALAYGVDSGSSGTILVYDLGGGTFDVSVLRAAEGVFQVLASRGEAHLGGDDFDNEIAEVLLERFKEETGIELKGDRLAMQKIVQAAEQAKMELSERQEALVAVPFLAANELGPCHLETRISRQEFEGWIGGYVEKTIRLTRGALQDARLRAEQIERVLLVGGSTRIPAVRRALEQLFGRPAEAGVNPEEVVACGAAVQGGILAGQAEATALVDVTPLGLGVETVGRRMVTLVPRNTVLPVQARAIFTTVADNQKTARIAVLQGERSRAEEDILLGSFELQNIERGRKGSPDIEVCFQIDVNGFVHVSAEDLGTGSRRDIELEGAEHLDAQRIQSMIVEARAAELEDALAAG
jgi:molecular chaperone DnaK